MGKIGGASDSSLLLFWDELEQLLGPILQPIVGPLFDILREEANRAIILSTIVTLFLFVSIVVYVVYEVPSILGLFSSGMSMSPAKPEPPILARRPSARTRTPSETQEEAMSRAKLPSISQMHGLEVQSTIDKHRDDVLLTIRVTNNSDHEIEMVVVDIDLPDGIDVMTGSFRMQRIGTISSGMTKTADFRLKHYRGSLENITGQIEFMSSSHEITEIAIPRPTIAADE
ncbi:MAG: hypothetical protein ACFFD3_13115 [Candidatus Thorarchaeota archaeon]